MRASRRTGAGVFGSRSMPRSAPCRASTRPHLRSRQTWTTVLVNSDFPAAVDGDEPAEDRLRFDLHKPGLADHLAELLHRRKTPDRLDKIAIAFLVACDGAADFRHDFHGIIVVDRREAGPAGRR